MNVVILHCHFERGGVTQVAENHVRFLRDCDDVDRIVMLSGPRIGGLSQSTLSAATCLQVADFDYDDDQVVRLGGRGIGQRAAAIARAVAEQLSQAGLRPGDTVLHWHNHGLGKNSAAPGVAARLASDGWRLLLHVHDFAEDNRPSNYLRLIDASEADRKRDVDSYLYPVFDHVHYATLTRADAGVLTQIGIPTSQSHWLPNSVVAPRGEQPSRDEALAKVRRVNGLPDSAGWLVYPVRGIRRKNVGEFLLLSRWTAADDYLGITLRPTTPVELQSYRRWQEVAGSIAPRAVFDVAHHADVEYADNLAACKHVVSTSVAEGFGMTFLEPWLSDRDVIARRLPSVVDDFADSSVRFDRLYDSIPVPGVASWLEQRRRETENAMTVAWSQIPSSFRPDLAKPSSDEDSIDFASLTPEAQEDVLARLNIDSGFEAEMMSRSEALIESLLRPADASVIQNNRAAIGDGYSLDRAGEQLLGIYRGLLSTAIIPERRSLSGDESGIDAVNRVRPYYPCRTESPDD